MTGENLVLHCLTAIAEEWVKRDMKYQLLLVFKNFTCHCFDRYIFLFLLFRRRQSQKGHIKCWVVGSRRVYKNLLGWITAI